MAHSIDRSLSSLTAIAAASLLLSTTAPALAQTQDTAAITAAIPSSAAQPPAAPAQAIPAPQSAAPQPEAPPVAAPQVVTPEAAPPVAAAPAPVQNATPTMTANAVVQPVPDTPPTAATAQAQPANDSFPQKASRTAQTVRQAAPAPRPAPALRPASAPAATTSETRTTTNTTSSGLTRRDPAGLYTGDNAPAAATQVPTARQSPYARYWPLEAAGAIILVGLIGYAATRRRRDEDDEYEAVETTEYVDDTPVVAETPVPVEMVPAPAVIAAQPVRGEPAIGTRAASLTTQEAPSASLLPDGPVPTGEARAALLDRMVAAEPDEANPFHTAKSRMRRARMILKTREQTLREKATEAFDWRTYQPSGKAYNLTHPTLASADDEAAPRPRADVTK